MHVISFEFLKFRMLEISTFMYPWKKICKSKLWYPISNFACSVIFFMIFCRLLTFFIIIFFMIFFREYYQSVKQFRSRSGPTFCWSWSGSKCFAKVASSRRKSLLASKESSPNSKIKLEPFTTLEFASIFSWRSPKVMVVLFQHLATRSEFMEEWRQEML